MNKKQPPKKTPRKRNKSGRNITGTSIAFETSTLEGLRSHELHTKKKLSVSWIVNQLAEKFLKGETVLE